jgi:hypothetical protein
VSRALTFRVVRVAPEDEVQYRAAQADEARRAAERGAHRWLFRSRRDPGTFVEFAEAASADLLGAADEDVWDEVT